MLNKFIQLYEIIA